MFRNFILHVSRAGERSMEKEDSRLLFLTCVSRLREVSGRGNSRLRIAGAALHFLQRIGDEGSYLIRFFAAVGVGLIETEVRK